MSAPAGESRPAAKRSRRSASSASSAASASTASTAARAAELAAVEPAPDNVRELPGADRLPRGARQVISTGRKAIYAVTDPADTAYGLWFPGRRCSPLPYLVDVLARRDASGTQRGVMYLLAAAPDAPRHVVTDKELAAGSWIGELALPVPEDKAIKEAVTTVIRELAAGRVPTEAEARWEGDRLVMPPAEVLPAGYLETAGDEATARRSWREVAELACRPGAENLALNLGAAWAAPYVRPLSRVRPVSALFAGVGAPRRGKSTNVNAGAALYGAPLRINPALSESAVAIGDQLAALGCLPFFRDEVHSAGWTPAQWKTYVMRTLNGAGRRRSASDGSGVVRSSREWWGFQFMSGNVDPRYGATDGVQARVIVLSDPHLPDRATSDRVTALLGESYGWPFRWFLAEHPTPASFRGIADRAAVELAELIDVPDGSAHTVAGTLAVAVAGAELFGRVLDVPELRGAALASAARVLDTLSCTLADQAVRFDDQLYAKVWSDVTDHPALWPTKGEYEDALAGRQFAHKAHDVHGVRHTLPDGREVLSMLVEPFRLLTAPLDLAVDQALSDLRARGLLIAGRKMGYRNKVSIAGLGKANAYMFRVPADDDGDQGGSHGSHPVPTAGTGSDQGGSHGSHGSHAEKDIRAYGDSQPAQTAFDLASDPSPAANAGTDNDSSERTEMGSDLRGSYETVTLAEASEPCERCGLPTPVRRDGRVLHLDPCPQPAQTAVAASDDATPADDTPAAPSGPQRAVRPAAEAVSDAELANAGRVIRDPEGGWPDATDADIAEAYALFRQATALPGSEALAGGVRMVGDPGFVGTKWVQLIRDSFSGSVTTAALGSELVESISLGGGLFRYLDHIRPGVELAEGGRVAVADVRAAYLAGALTSLLGHGEPAHYTSARSIRQVTERPKWSKAPGYVRLAETPKLTVPVAALAELAAGSWVATPLVDFLLNPWPGRGPLVRGGELAVSELVYWHRGDYGKRLERWASAARDAGYALAGMPGLPARYALHLVKRVRNAFLGGYIRSDKYNRNPELVRLDWSDMVVSQTGANVLRKTARATVEHKAPEPIGIYRDDVWYADAVPDALTSEIVPGKIGKLSVKGIVPVTGHLAEAVTNQSPYEASRAIAAALRGER